MLHVIVLVKMLERSGCKGKSGKLKDTGELFWLKAVTDLLKLKKREKP